LKSPVAFDIRWIVNGTDMKKYNNYRIALSSWIAAAALVGGSAAWAQAAPGTAARMQAEKATCDGVQQDKAACLREAGAARQAAVNNDLTTDGRGGNDTNAMARCKLQPQAERSDCVSRLKGSINGTTTTSGSVMGGGMIRETVTPVPATAR
jgi:hypothetical protein